MNLINFFKRLGRHDDDPNASTVMFPHEAGHGTPGVDVGNADPAFSIPRADAGSHDPGFTLLRSQPNAVPALGADAAPMAPTNTPPKTFKDLYGEPSDWNSRERIVPGQPVQEVSPITGPEGTRGLDYGGYNPDAYPTTDTQKPLTGSRASGKAYQDALNAPLKPNPSFFKRLGSGVVQGARRWAQSGGQGGIAGLAGAVATGSVGGAFIPSYSAKMQKEANVSKMFKRYATDVGMEQTEYKRQKEEADAQKADLQRRMEMAKPRLDALKDRGHALPGEVEMIRALYGIDATDPQNPTFVELDNNGDRLIRYKDDPRYVVNTTVPTKPNQVPQNVSATGADGSKQTFSVLPSQGLSAVVAAGQAQAGRQERAGTREAERHTGDVKAENDRQRRINDAKADIDQSNATLRSLRKGVEEKKQQGLDTTELDKQIAIEEGRLANAQKRAKEPELTKTEPAKRLPTEKEARQHYASQGKTPAQIEELIQKGKAAGVIK